MLTGGGSLAPISSNAFSAVPLPGSPIMGSGSLSSISSKMLSAGRSPGCGSWIGTGPVCGCGFGHPYICWNSQMR